MLLQPALDLSFWPEKVSSFLQRNQITIRSWLSTLSYTSLIVLFSLVNLISFRLNLVLLEIDTLLELERLLALSNFLKPVLFQVLFLLFGKHNLALLNLFKEVLPLKIMLVYTDCTRDKQDPFCLIKNWFNVNIWYLMSERLYVFALTVMKLIE